MIETETVEVTFTATLDIVKEWYDDASALQSLRVYGTHALRQVGFNPRDVEVAFKLREG